MILYIGNILYKLAISTTKDRMAYTEVEIGVTSLDVVEVDVVSARGESEFLSTDAEEDASADTVVLTVVESVDGSTLGLGVVNCMHDGALGILKGITIEVVNTFSSGIHLILNGVLTTPLV